MRLADIVSAPWAITQEMFDEVQGIYARHCRGDKIDISGIEARIGAPLKNTRNQLQVEDGVAIISLEGVLAKRANLFMQISGGTSYQIAGQQLTDALSDPAVHSIVLAIDSPGGTVDGTQALADQVFAARGKKPIVAVADGVMASAAYWVGSAADKVYITGDTTLTGSIGVIMTHTDYSAADMANGVRKTEIKAGKYKQMGSSNAPLGMAEKDTLQAMVDANYKVFLSAVARNRGEDINTVNSEMAEGRMFLGRAAIDAGLVDGVSTLDQVCAALCDDQEPPTGAPGSSMSASAGVASQPQVDKPTTEQTMDKLTVDSVRKDAPDVAKALIDEGIAQGRAAGLVEGQKAETQRIVDLEALIEPGNEKLIAAFKADGKTSGPDAAFKLHVAANEARKAKLKDLNSDAAGAQAASGGNPPANDPNAVADFNPHAIARKARAHKEAQRALGLDISDSEAVAYVTAKKEA
jgi:signal peptide peptidase SppA